MIDHAETFALAADLALELISSAYGRGEEGAGPDDSRVTQEARAIQAIRFGDRARIATHLRAFADRRKAEFAELERQYGRRG